MKNMMDRWDSSSAVRAQYCCRTKHGPLKHDTNNDVFISRNLKWFTLKKAYLRLPFEIASFYYKMGMLRRKSFLHSWNCAKAFRFRVIITFSMKN
jgi:hypothetical protein